MSAPSAVSPHGGAGPGLRDGFSPALIMEVELTEPLSAVSYDGRHDRAWVLGRLHGEPVGSCVIWLDAAGVAPGQLAALLWPDLCEPVTDRFAAVACPRLARSPARDSRPIRRTGCSFATAVRC